MGTIIKQGQIRYKDKWILGDILIQDGRIMEINSHISAEGHQMIDAKNNLVLPGFIDMHVHLRDPGFTHKETIKTGTKAAVIGGFTTICPMPNTKPITDNIEIVNYINKKSKEEGFAKVRPIAAITIGESGKELTDFEQLKSCGVVGFSDDGKGIQGEGLMKKAMEKAKQVNLPIIAHCEDESLVHGGVIHDGKVAKTMGIKGISSDSEFVQLERDIALAEETGVHYHVCHISTKESVELVREAKKRGVKITAEVTPHHLILSENNLKEPLSMYKMNPPLRSEEDRMALIEGIKDGAIDIIATDHAPHALDEKLKGVYEAPFGIIGSETAFPVLYTQFVQKDIISLEELINMLTLKPAQLFKVEGGEIEVGNVADITIVNLNRTKRVTKEVLGSMGENTPFIDWELNGWPILTMVDGEVKWEEGERNNE